MIDENGKYLRDYPDLKSVGDNSYENIFKVFKNDDGFYFYNILKKVSMDGILRPGTFYKQRVDRKLPYTGLSYMVYGTIDLWWLICITNNITNPVQMPKPGSLLKIVHPRLVNNVIENIKAQL